MFSLTRALRRKQESASFLQSGSQATAKEQRECQLSTLCGFHMHTIDLLQCLFTISEISCLSGRDLYLLTKNKWQLVYLAGRTVRCLASMYDKPFTRYCVFITAEM